MTCRAGWARLLTVNVLGYCILSLSQATTATPPKSEMPVASPAEQRMEIIAELSGKSKSYREPG